MRGWGGDEGVSRLRGEGIQEGVTQRDLCRNDCRGLFRCNGEMHERGKNGC